jgi:hypothetical protein
MSEELKVIISSDVDKSLKALLSLSNAFEELTAVTKTLTTQFGSLSAAIPKFDSAASKAKKGTDSMGKSAANASGSLLAFSRIVQDAPFGFIAIGNNITQFVEQFAELKRQTGSTGAAFKGLIGQLAGAGGMTLAFSAVTSILTSLVQKYGSLSNAISVLNPLLSSQQRLINELNLAWIKNAEGIGKEVANVDLMVAAVKNLNVPLEQRKIITEELIKQYPDTFKGLTAEAIAVGKADAAYKELTTTLIAQGAIKAGNDLIGQRAGELLALRIESAKLSKELADLRDTSNDSFFGSLADKGKQIAGVQNEINKNAAQQAKIQQQVAGIQAEQIKLVQELGSKVLGIKPPDTVLKIFNELNQALEKVNERVKLTGESARDVASTKISLLSAAFDKIAAIGGEDSKSILKTIGDQIRALQGTVDAKKIKTAADIIKELNNDLRGLDSAFAAAGGSLRDLSEDKIKKITDALKSLADVGVLPGSDLFNALKSQIEALQSTFTRTPVSFKIPITIEPLGAVSNAATISRVLKGTQDEFRKQLSPFTDQVNEIIRQGTISGITSLSEGIGEALVSGNFNAVVGGFVDAIAGFMGQLGKLLIAQGVAIQAFQVSLDTLQGIPAIIAGGALVAASAAFRALAKGGTSSFATGGTVFGPTLAMIGDNPGREEHIVPSEVLDKIGGGAFPDEVVFTIRGTDLVAAVNRGNTYQGRINGRR